VSGLPGGNRNNNGTYNNLGNKGNWWSSTETVANAWYRNPNYNNDNVNRKHVFLKTIPFGNIGQTSTGNTIVFNSDSIKVYEVDKEVFLSNDGKIIAYVIDREFKWDEFQNV
jgi:hypothetical protein